MPELPAAAQATLRIGGKTLEMPVAQGASRAIFTGVELPEGPARIEAALKAGGRTFGPPYVDVGK